MSGDPGIGDASPAPGTRRLIAGSRHLHYPGAVRWVAEAHGHAPVRPPLPLTTDQGPRTFLVNVASGP